jgi:IMP dehydrogenase
MEAADLALTFDDVLLVPAFSKVLPRDVDLSISLTRRIQLQIPLLSAAMDTVTEARAAIGIAQAGGLGVIHRNMTPNQQAVEVAGVKKFESGIIMDPICIQESTRIGEVLQLVRDKGISGLPVLNSSGRLSGIVTRRDLRFGPPTELAVTEVMTPRHRLVTASPATEKSEIASLLHEHRIEKVLLVDENDRLVGLITAKDLHKEVEFPHASKDEQGRLRVAAAIGTGEDTEERLEQVLKAGVDAIVVDTAHGHSASVLDLVARIKRAHPEVDVIAGNIATGVAARAMADAGADVVKVGIGPGSICTTRIVAGVGVPQITAVNRVAKALAGTGVTLVSDGGIRFSGDIAKAIAAGAHAVMVGGLLAGTDEAPGEIELYQGRSYKSYRGMGSLGAMQQGSKDRYFQSEEGDPGKLVPEGIEGRVPYKGPMKNILHQLIGGLRASMGYTGCADLSQMRSQCRFVRITQAGVHESHVHDVSVVKESPNYQRGD